MSRYLKGLMVAVGVLALSTSTFAAPGYEEVEISNYNAYAAYGTGKTYCGQNCKSSQGLKMSTNGRCGTGVTCFGSKFGNCCSEAGSCGSNKQHCGEGCQNAFGQCSAPKITSSSSNTYSAGSTLVPGSSKSKDTSSRSSESLLVSTISTFTTSSVIALSKTASITSSPVSNNKYSDCDTKTITVTPTTCATTSRRICAEPDCIVLQKIGANCGCPVSDMVYTSTVTLPCSNTCAVGCGVDYSTTYTPCPATPTATLMSHTTHSSSASSSVATKTTTY